MQREHTHTPRYEAVVAGHLCIDLAPQLSPGELSAQLRPGKIVQVGPMLVTTGGVVSNTGLPLLSMGVRAALVGCVGDDAVADLTVSYMRARGGDAQLRVKPGVGSSYTVVLSPPGSDRVFLHHPGVNDAFAKDDIDWDAVSGARLFHFGYPPLMRAMYADGGEALAAMMREAKGRGMTTSLDLALPDPDSDAGRADWGAILSRVMPHVDVCLPSIEEALYMLDRGRYERIRAASGDFIEGLTRADIECAAQRLLDLGAGIAVVKLGHRGLYGRAAGAARLGDMRGVRVGDVGEWADAGRFRPSYAVRVLSTSGAGDCSIAGFLAALLRGYGFEACLDLACLAGAMKVEQPGSVGEMGPIEAMREALGRERNANAWD